MNTDTIQSKEIFALMLRVATLDWKMELLLSAKYVLWTERNLGIVRYE